MPELLSVGDLAAVIAASPLAMLAALFLLGSALAEFGVRWLRTPRFAALVVAGLVFSAVVKALAGLHMAPLIGPWLEAVGMLMLFEVGQRLSFEWLRRNPWLLAASVIESGLSCLAIFVLLRSVFDLDPAAAAVIAVICMASSPVVVLAVAKDLRARGQVTERALLLSTLSTGYAALVLQLVVTGALATGGVAVNVVMHPIYQLCASFLLGAAAAAVLLLFARIVPARGSVQVVAVAALCALVYITARPLELSPLLAAMAFGLVTRARDVHRRIAAFEMSESGTLLAIAFFVLTGAALRWQLPWRAWLIAAAIVVVRVVVKIAANFALAAPSSLVPRKGALVGVAQMPLAGVSLMFAANIATTYPSLLAAVEPAFAVVAILAVFGSFATEAAIRRANENTAAGNHHARTAG